MNKVFLILLLVNLAFSLPDLVKFSDEHKGAKPVDEHPRLKNLFDGLKSNSTGLKRGERVLNGIPASLGQFPHQALLYMFDPKVNGWYLCGGSFIRYNFVLTAAHCVYGYSQVDIYGGIIDRSVGPAYFKFTITNPGYLLTHEGYNPSTILNDVGLAYMPGAPANLLTGYAGTYIKGINLPYATDSSFVLDGKWATTSGFGLLNDATQSNILRYASVSIIANSQCSAVFGSVVTAGNVCISTTNGYGTCGGDSGGPLVYQIRAGENTLVGVTSFGAASGCALSYPTGFSRVTYFLPWINAKLAAYP